MSAQSVTKDIGQAATHFSAVRVLQLGLHTMPEYETAQYGTALIQTLAKS